MLGMFRRAGALYAIDIPLQPCKSVAGRRHVTMLAFSIERNPNVSTTWSYCISITDRFANADTSPLFVPIGSR
jgi:hypothetical protein